MDLTEDDDIDDSIRIQKPALMKRASVVVLESNPLESGVEVSNFKMENLADAHPITVDESNSLIKKLKSLE